MFLSCIIHGAAVCGLGEGGVNVFVGGGGRAGCDVSMNEYSEASSKGTSILDTESKDSDEGDEWLNDLSSCNVAVTFGTMVSVLDHEWKHPET